MALEKVTAVDRIEVLENGTLQIRTKTTILEDGAEVSANYARETRTPGQDVSRFAKRVQDVAAAVWTPDVVEAYQAAAEEED